MKEITDEDWDFLDNWSVFEDIELEKPPPKKPPPEKPNFNMGNWDFN